MKAKVKNGGPFGLHFDVGDGATKESFIQSDSENKYLVIVKLRKNIKPLADLNLWGLFVKDSYFKVIMSPENTSQFFEVLYAAQKQELNAFFPFFKYSNKERKLC